MQTCSLRGLPGPGPRVTFCAARKSPKSRLREGGFRFPPSLKDPISLKRPRPGAPAPALDPAPGGRDGSAWLLLLPQVPGQRQRKEKGGAFKSAPNFCHACHLVQDHLVEARVHLGLYPKPLLLLHPGALLFFSAEKKRRGPKNGQDGKSMPCKQKSKSEEARRKKCRADARRGGGCISDKPASLCLEEEKK